MSSPIVRIAPMHDGGITAQPKPHAEIFYSGGEVTLSCMPRSFAPVIAP